jgi:hypothetical protein
VVSFFIKYRFLERRSRLIFVSLRMSKDLINRKQCLWGKNLKITFKVLNLEFIASSLYRFYIFPLKTLRTKRHIQFCQKKKSYRIFLFYFSYLEKKINKGRVMQSPCCVSMYPPKLILKAEPIFMKLGINIMAPDLNSMVYLINPSHQSVCICIPLPLLGNGLVKKIIVATNTYATIEELLDQWFSMRSVSYQRKQGD